MNIPKKPIEIDAGLTPSGLHTALGHLGISLRYNERSKVFELDYGDGQFIDLDNHRREYLCLVLLPENFYYIKDTDKPEDKTRLEFSKDRFQRVLYAGTHDFRIDPFEEYLLSLPKLKLKKTDIDNYNLEIDKIFFDLYDQVSYEADGYSAEDDRLFHSFVSRSMLLAPVHRTLNPGCKYDEVIVITGTQGAGKDALFKSLVPYPSLHTTSLSFGDADNRKVEKSLGKAIVVASEMSGLVRDADIDSVKQWITTQSDRTRLSYRTDAEEIPRRFVVVCTSNADQPLPPDPTGNRRWCVIKLQNGANCRVEDWIAKRRDHFWAEAMALYRLNSHETALQIPHKLREVQAIKNGGYAKGDDMLIDAWNYAISHKNLHLNYPYTPSAIGLALGLIQEATQYIKLAKSYQYRIEDLMISKGYEKMRKRFDVGDVKPRMLTVWVPITSPYHSKFTGDTEIDMLNYDIFEITGTRWEYSGDSGVDDPHQKVVDNSNEDIDNSDLPM